jgi:hypothetical protein
MLRLLQVGNSLPISLPVEPSAEFEPGTAGQLTVFGNQVVCGVSDGTAPFGIIDDVKKNAFTAASVDEIVIAPASQVAVQQGSTWVTTMDIKVELENPNITASSFISNPVDVELIARNGVITFLSGTELNFDMDGDGTPDSIRTVVSYAYQQPNVPGDDSTAASGRLTIWFQRMLASTDQFETNQRYPVNSALYVSEAGLFTTRQSMPNIPSVAMVTAPPTAMHSSLELLWL